MMQRDQSIRTLDPCSLRILSPYYLRRHPYSISRLRTVCVLPTHAFVYCRFCWFSHTYCISTVATRHTISVLSSLYADSADICTLIWSADRVQTPWTEYGGWRRQYGASTEWLYPQHLQLSKFGCGLGRIRSEIHRHSKDTVRIPRGSRLIENLLRSATSVRRCERGSTTKSVKTRAQHLAISLL